MDEEDRIDFTNILKDRPGAGDNNGRKPSDVLSRDEQSEWQKIVTFLAAAVSVVIVSRLIMCSSRPNVALMCIIFVGIGFGFYAYLKSLFTFLIRECGGQKIWLSVLVVLLCFELLSLGRVTYKSLRYEAWVSQKIRMDIEPTKVWQIENVIVAKDKDGNRYFWWPEHGWSLWEDDERRDK